MHRTLAIIEREMRRFSKSPMLIVMSMVFPLLQLIVLGYAFGGNVKHLSLAIVDQDRGVPAVRLREMASAVSSGAHTLDIVSYGDQGTAVNDLRNGPNWHDTAIIVTYDEHGGFWDHVAPPTDKRHSDIWGPGARVPALIVSPLAKRHFVDHRLYDTTSILATIERRWDLEPLGTRDARANDLRHVFTLRGFED